jgi:hypothetical protein
MIWTSLVSGWMFVASASSSWHLRVPLTLAVSVAGHALLALGLGTSID